MDLRSRTERDFIATSNLNPRFETCLCKVTFFLIIGIWGIFFEFINDYSPPSEPSQSWRILGSKVGLIPMRFLLSILLSFILFLTIPLLWTIFWKTRNHSHSSFLTWWSIRGQKTNPPKYPWRWTEISFPSNITGKIWRGFRESFWGTWLQRM